MGAFKLGKMTFGSLFKKPETIMYPIESKPQPAGLKGHIAIEVETCILCSMCERSCATDCIKVDKAARTWSIDRLSCVQCGYCITVCPKKCLSMDPNYAPATTSRTIDSFAVPQAEGQEAKAKSAQPQKEPAQESKPEKAATATAPESTGTGDTAAVGTDEQLVRLIGLMDADKGEKVKKALRM